MTGRPPELGRLGVWGHLDSLSIADARAYARRADELGFGTLWVPETVGREPFSLLGLLAGETSQMRLGTSIVSIWGHDAQTTRMAALTLQEASGGRFVLGLGVSHPHLAQRLRTRRSCDQVLLERLQHGLQRVQICRLVVDQQDVHSGIGLHGRLHSHFSCEIAQRCCDLR